MIRRSRHVPQLIGGSLVPDQAGRRSRRSGRLWPVSEAGGLFSLLSTDFDGVNQHATAGDVDRYNLDLRSKAVTLSCWFKTIETGGQSLFGKNQASILTGYRFQLSGGVFTFVARGGAGTNRIVVTTPVTAADNGEWHHILFTLDDSGDGNSAAYYFDGSALSPIVGDNGLVSNTLNNGDFMVGDRDFDAPGPTAFDGLIDDVAIYQIKVSAGEAAAIYGGGRPPDLRTVGPFLNGMIGYWFMGDGDTFPVIKNRCNPAPYEPNTTSVDLNNDTINEWFDFTNYLAVEVDKNSTWSAGAWVKYTGFPANRGLIGRAEFDAPSQWHGWRVRVGNGGNVHFELKASQFDNMVVSGGNIAADNEWHHVMVTYGGGNSRANMKTYIDGELQGSSTSGSATLTADIVNIAVLAVGSTNITNDFLYFEGGIQHSFFYNVELTVEEIRSIGGSGVPQDLNVVLASHAANLVHWCALGDGDAIGAGNMIDLSGNGENGTFVNGESGDFVADVNSLGGPDLTMVNMAANDFVADTPS